jgi:hypothetical protein
MLGRDIVEVLTKCRVQHFWRVTLALLPGEREAAFPVKRLASLPSETQEDSFMSDVLPSIIVLAITTLLVFRRQLTTPRAKKGAPRRAGATRPSKAR